MITKLRRNVKTFGFILKMETKVIGNDSLYHICFTTVLFHCDFIGNKLLSSSFKEELNIASS